MQPDEEHAPKAWDRIKAAMDCPLDKEPQKQSAATTWVCSPHGTRVVQEDEPQGTCPEADRAYCVWERVPAAKRQEFLLVLALKVDKAQLEPIVKSAITAAVDYSDSEAHVYAKAVDDLVAADLDALAALIGWDAVLRLRVGDVVSVGLSTSPDGARGERSDAGLADTVSPIYEDCSGPTREEVCGVMDAIQEFGA